MAEDRSRTAVTGSPELPLAHGRASDRAENGYPRRKTEGSILTKCSENCIYCRGSCGAHPPADPICRITAEGKRGAEAETGTHE